MVKSSTKKIVFTIIMLLICILIHGNVSAFSLEKPDGKYYLRRVTNTILEMTVDEFISIGIVETENQTIYKPNGEVANGNEMLSTGMYYNNKDSKQVTIIVKGDINGNGTVTATDLSILKQVYTNIIERPSYEYLKAVDLNNDNEITSTDISLLKMFLVGIELPEEELDPNAPKLNGEIEIQISPETVSKEVTITVVWPDGENLDGYVKKVSLDGGETFEEYTGPITIKENASVIAGYYKEEGDPLGETVFLIDNIDTIAPDDFEFTYDATTESITLNATTKDKLKDYQGNLVETEYTGIAKYQYKLDDGEWQDSNVFTGLTADTEYTVYVKAIDYAGNEKEATNNGLKVRTEAILDVNDSTILVSYSTTNVTNLNVIVTFKFADETLDEKYDIQYQVGETEGEWITGNEYVATGNCVIYARVIDNNNQASNTYVTANVKNIDKLQPLAFTPEVKYENSQDKTIVKATVEDAPENEQNISSGVKYYTFYEIHKKGSIVKTSEGRIEENYLEYEGNLSELKAEEADPIIGFIVDAEDEAGNIRKSNAIYIKDETDPDGNMGTDTDIDLPDTELGIGNFNEGPGNITIQGADKSYRNPVIPVGFKAVNTSDANWGPYLPSGWNNGLVIEDKVGNQFIWVPVPCEEGTDPKDAIDAMMRNTRETCNYLGTTILEDEVPSMVEISGASDETGKYGYLYTAEILKQVEDYQGFYIGRYEAGRKDGKLAVQKGLQTVNAVTYEEAKQYAESMYVNPYVVSGLPTGVHWDLLSGWVAEEKGMDFILRNRSNDGNLWANTFSFTGEYAEGPQFGSGEQRGPYKYGTNVNKPAGTAMLLTTGIVESFKIKNAYDLWGNVWEYTTEGVIDNANGLHGRNARAGDYYWETNLEEELAAGLRGIYYRGHVPDGDARNEGGFRPVLFLSEGDFNSEGDYNRTINGGQANYSNPVIPAGYEPKDTATAKWGNGSTPAVDWDKGLVITDKNGNEFVWVPVDGTNVKYETWLDVYLTHDEVGTSEVPSSLGEAESATVSRFGGFYIARFETSTDAQGNAQTKENATVKTNVSYNEAVELTKEFKTGKTSVAGIVTGTQWDTVMKWIANEKGEDAVKTDSASWGRYNSSMGRTGSSYAKNIADLAGNAWELTSETYEGKIVYRGGSAYETGSDAPAGYRDAYEKTYKDNSTTYRMVLYVKDDGYGQPNVSVGDDKPLPGTSNGNIIFTPINFTGWTRNPITIQMTPNNIEGNIMYAYTQAESNTTSEWKIGNQITVSVNGTISAKVVDNNGNALTSVETFIVGHIDLTPPAEFTPTVTVEGNRVRIKCSTTDSQSGIKQYHFFMDNGVAIRDCTAETEVVSISLPIGSHQIYVVAEDNAGNTRESSRVAVNITSSRLYDIAKPGDYVAVSISENRAPEYVLKILGVGPRNGRPCIQLETLCIDTWEEYGGESRDYLCKRFVGGYNFSIPDANIQRGAGTKFDPYYIDRIVSTYTTRN